MTYVRGKLERDKHPVERQRTNGGKPKEREVACDRSDR